MGHGRKAKAKVEAKGQVENVKDKRMRLIASELGLNLDLNLPLDLTLPLWLRL
jgi:hypothetical protein